MLYSGLKGGYFRARPSCSVDLAFSSEIAIGRRPIAIGEISPRSTDQEVGFRRFGLSEGEGDLTPSGPTGARHVAISCCMSSDEPISGTTEAGNTWKLTPGACGYRLWIPATGKKSKPSKLPARVSEHLTWVASKLGVAPSRVPQILVDKLTSIAGD